MTNFTITDRAKAKLVAYTQGSELDAPLPAIVCKADADESPEWDIGLYEKHKVPEEWTVTISGIAISIDPYWIPQLKDKTLDFVNNRFEIL